MTVKSHVDATEIRLIAALQRQALAETAQAILAEGVEGVEAAMLRRAIACCAAISEHMRIERSEIVEHLRSAGVSAQPVPGHEDSGALQFHRISVGVPRDHLARAVHAAGETGFQPAFPLGPGRCNALARTATELTLVRFDSETVRLTLRLNGQPPTRLPAALRPRLADLGAADLPASLAAAYPLLRLVRILRERLTGRRSPLADTDFIGTPVELIEPLLDLLSPTPQDVLVDIGCGDGRVVAQAAERYGCRAIGIESNPAIAETARRRLVERGLPPARAEIRTGSAETADLSGATVLFVFLPGHLQAQLLPRIIAGSTRDVRILGHEQTAPHVDATPEQTRLVVGKGAVTAARIWRGAG